MPLGGSFGGVGSFGGTGGINRGSVDLQGKRKGDLGFTRFTSTTAPVFKQTPKFFNNQDQNIVRREFANTGIPGYNPIQEPPKVDLFKENGGYAGLIGLQGPLAPGTYKLNDLLGIPASTPGPVTPQYSQEEATQNLSQQLAGIANASGGTLKVPTNQSPLSPQNTGNNKKGPKTPSIGVSV